jgi:VIT1/CCC1 family predicted Fe2+/Mn2+ transporter
MRPTNRHAERHRTAHTRWLRAAVLGANDGIVSTASLVAGVAAAHASRGSVLLAGASALVAGAMSMAAGEYVSVHSQADTERADLARERAEIEADRPAEQRELAGIYVRRGLAKDLAATVAAQLMAHDALGAHARDELGISDSNNARPVQAALASAASFATGAALPLAVAAAISPGALLPWLFGSSLGALALLGSVAARAGGASPMTGALRVTFWGALAMAVTAGVGALLGDAG